LRQILTTVVIGQATTEFMFFIENDEVI
jgi:multisubunit Na+/H+ antiporter MnhC subunit